MAGDRPTQILLDIADELDRASSPWDGEEVDGEDAFLSLKFTIAEAIRSAVKRSLRGHSAGRRRLVNKSR